MENSLWAERFRLLDLLRKRNLSEQEGSIESPGNERLRLIIQSYSDLVTKSWPSRINPFAVKVKQAEENFSANKRDVLQKYDRIIKDLNKEIEQFSRTRLADLDQPQRREIGALEGQITTAHRQHRNSVESLEKAFSVNDFAPGATADHTSILQVLRSPRFAAYWFWIAGGALLLVWLNLSFTAGVLAAAASVVGFAFIQLNEVKSHWNQLAALRARKDREVAEKEQSILALRKLIADKERVAREEVKAFERVKRSEIAAVEGEKRDKLDALQNEYYFETGALVAEWEQIKTNFQNDLHSVHLDFDEVIAASNARLEKFSQNDPVRDEIDDLASQLEFRIGSSEPARPASLPTETVELLDVDPAVLELGCEFPVMFSLLQRKALLIHADNEPASSASIRIMDNILTRILRQVPPGKAIFTLFDPLGLGSNFAPYLKLQDFSDKLIDGTVWTSRQQIKRQLENIISHIEGVNKLYLKADYPDIEAFNKDAKEIREPYRFLVISDFPEGFNDDSLRDLVRIVQNGPRCGVHSIIYWNKTGKEFHGFDPAELTKFAIHLDKDRAGGKVLRWTDEQGITRQQPLHLDPPPSRDHIKAVVDSFGADAVDAMTIEVPFDSLYGLSGYSLDWWELSSASQISVPIGPIGANDAQLFKFDSKMSNNALIVGRPGSGKSNLMHVIISMMAHKYSPEEVELYLVDFKKGVEFKDYARAGLPHAKVIAVESEREFGLSVLEALDREMLRRSEVFKAHQGVEGLAQYRELHPNEKMPRCVLLIDEFQELFSREDKIKDEASILLDRVVRQGRSFGVHVILGTQSLHNSGLMRSTTDQIPIRIALQCSEADSRAILADDNVEARSLSRPGEAIYNDMGGLIEGNKRFQVALFGNKDRKAFLERQVDALDGLEWSGPKPRVFEGHEPASLSDCDGIARFDPLDANASIPLWIGEPVSMEKPISQELSVQAGRNLIVVAREEKTAVHVILSAIASLAARLSPRDLRVQIIDLSTADAAWADDPERLEAAYSGHRIEVGGKLDLKHVIPELCEILDKRQENGENGPREVLAIIGAHRARNLRRSSSSGAFGLGFDDGKDTAPDMAQMLARLAEEGPEHGIHTMLWVDGLSSFEKIYDRSGLESFALRIAGPLPDRDSHTLFESNAANAIDKPNRMIAYDDDLVGVVKLFRPYTIPDNEFFERLVRQQLDQREKEPAQ